jgi:hypothetical protein
MAGVYEDNFGFWEIDGPEERAFFEHVRMQSLDKSCERCKRAVRLMPRKILCASCASALECGAPASISGYDQALAREAGPCRVRQPRRSRTNERIAAHKNPPR